MLKLLVNHKEKKGGDERIELAPIFVVFSRQKMTRFNFVGVGLILQKGALV
jgi:hypothetical protein